MKILFVYPNTNSEGAHPLGLSIMSSILKHNGHDVKIFDTTFISKQVTSPIKSCEKEMVYEECAEFYDLTYSGLDHRHQAVLDYCNDNVGKFRDEIVGYYKPDLNNFQYVDWIPRHIIQKALGIKSVNTIKEYITILHDKGAIETYYEKLHNKMYLLRPVNRPISDLSMPVSLMGIDRLLTGWLTPQNISNVYTNKQILSILTSYGISDCRPSIERDGKHIQIRAWQGIKSSQGSQDSQGISTPIEISSLPLETKYPDYPDYVDNVSSTKSSQGKSISEKNNKEGEKDLHGYDSILETDKSDKQILSVLTSYGVSDCRPREERDGKSIQIRAGQGIILSQGSQLSHGISTLREKSTFAIEGKYPSTPDSQNVLSSTGLSQGKTLSEKNNENGKKRLHDSDPTIEALRNLGFKTCVKTVANFNSNYVEGLKLSTIVNGINGMNDFPLSSPIRETKSKHVNLVNSVNSVDDRPKTISEKNNEKDEKLLHDSDKIKESDNTNFDSLNTEPIVEEERIDGSKSN